MQQDMFYIAREGQQEGPITLEDIVKRVNEKTLDVSDYLYDEQAQDWVMIMAYAPLAERMKATKPATPPAPPAQLHKKTEEPKPVQATPEWFVLKGDSRFGPFSYAELIKMLQDKSIFEFDYVWTAKMKTWERIATLPDFSPDAIRLLRESGLSGLNEVFFRRRHARASYGASLLVHNDKQVYKGKSLEVSEGGAGIVIHNAHLQPGDRLHLHFAPGDGLPPFNAKCEIVSKRFVDASDKEAPVQYGVKFTDLNEQAMTAITTYTQKAVAA